MTDSPYSRFRPGKDPRSVALASLKRVLSEYREGRGASACMSQIEEIYRKFLRDAPRKQRDRKENPDD